MINKLGLDLVGVFLLRILHDIHARFALWAGFHVLVEKPMARSQ